MTVVEPKANAPTVLFFDSDWVEAAYISAVMIQRGIDVRRSFGNLGTAIDALAEVAHFHAAVVAYNYYDESTERLIQLLRRREIPCLLLLAENKTQSQPADLSALVIPFAAFQVADWVLSRR